MADRGMVSERFRFSVGGHTDTGRARERNEDAFGLYIPPRDDPSPTFDGVFVVADGLGGHSGGDEASSLVVESVQSSAVALAGRDIDPEQWLRHLLLKVHEALVEHTGGEGDDAMGSTATVAVAQGDRLVVGHVGDTRLYRLRDGALLQLTEDDSWVAEQLRAGVLSEEEAEDFEHKNWLTQSLGVGASVRITTYEFSLATRDRYLLCSDGLHGLVSDPETEQVLRNEANPDAAVRRLIDMANDAGGMDNVTALVFDTHDRTPDSGATTLQPGTTAPAERTGGFTAARGRVLLGIVLLTGAAAVAWMTRTPAVTPDPGAVAADSISAATIPASESLRVLPTNDSATDGSGSSNPQE